MRKKFADLKARMPAGRRARVEARSKKIIAELLLAEIRLMAGQTQKTVAQKLGITQPSLSKLEAQEDMYVGTLRRLVEALGGSLELIAHMPKGDIRIRPLGGSAAAS